MQAAVTDAKIEQDEMQNENNNEGKQMYAKMKRDNKRTKRIPERM